VKPLHFLSAVLVAFLAGATVSATAQIHDPVQWDFALYDNGDGTLDLDFHAAIEPGWHVYSQFLNPFDGPIPTSFTIETEGVQTADTAAAECEPHLEYDPNFMMDLFFFEEDVHWVHTLSFPGAIPESVKGYLTFMVCDDSKCLPPEDVDFNLSLSDLKSESAKPDYCGGEGQGNGLVTGENDAPMGIYDPVQWDIALHTSGDHGATVVATAEIQEGWHVYSHDNDPLDGPIPTDFTIATEGIEVGVLRECTPETRFDPNFDKDVKSFHGTVRWALDVSWTGDRPEKIDGLLTYMTCDDTKCVFPPDIEFYLPLDEALTDAVPELCPGDQGTVTEAKGNEMGDGLWTLFILGLGAGLLAIITPCVFPLIPMTVSYFTKQSKTRAEGIRNALIYGASIIVIYTGLGLLLTVTLGVDFLNLLSTDPIFNLFLFLLLVVFGISFLGAFEIQLPTSWANKMDAQADRGGLIGIFFMAATLAIVSFSCTGPIVGSALAGAATGDYGGPIAIMFGFSLSLASVFALFSAFPGWLNSLPKSGGWLTSVKVWLGLVEIGLALKFISISDLQWKLGLLDRNLYLALSLVIALSLGLYLLGAIRFPHDGPLKRVSIIRGVFAAKAWVLAGIILVALLGHSTADILNGFLPPIGYAPNNGNLSLMGLSNTGIHTIVGVLVCVGVYLFAGYDFTGQKQDRLSIGRWTLGALALSFGLFFYGASFSEAETHVEARFLKYDQALEAAKVEGKPLLIDFTGWACVNCRKMEEEVWPSPEVADFLMNKTVLVSLYVDDREKLPENEHRLEQFGGKDFRIRTVGNKWTFLQASRFGTNAQPFYVMIDHDGKALGDGVGYDPDPQKFIDFLKENYARFEAGK